MNKLKAFGHSYTSAQPLNGYSTHGVVSSEYSTDYSQIVFK